MHEAFVAFIPLSNWLLGFDRYAMAYSKRSIPQSTFPDAFYLLREDEPWAVGLERSAAEGFGEVCFKELYVSSLSENRWAGSAVNAYARTHQVPLAVVLEGLAALGLARTGELPWGSPIFEGTVRGRPMRVAAYTEPSVGWERSHALVRSWNLMADGTCLASLEDPASAIEGAPA